MTGCTKWLLTVGMLRLGTRLRLCWPNRAVVTLGFILAPTSRSSRSTQTIGTVKTVRVSDLLVDSSFSLTGCQSCTVWLYGAEHAEWDPNGILAWLTRELDEAEKAQQRVWIGASPVIYHEGAGET